MWDEEKKRRLMNFAIWILVLIILTTIIFFGYRWWLEKYGNKTETIKIKKEEKPNLENIDERVKFLNELTRNNHIDKQERNRREEMLDNIVKKEKTEETKKNTQILDSLTNSTEEEKKKDILDNLVK